MAEASVAVYPGSFDPITTGHLDVIERAAKVFDRLIVGVLANPRKTPLLSVDERLAIIRESLAEALPAELAGRVAATAFDGLTVEFCLAQGARFVVRGLRAISDFEAELQLAHTNRVLAPEVDTMFFMTALGHGYVSSSLAREIASFGGDVSSLVPAPAVAALRRHLGPEFRLTGYLERVGRLPRSAIIRPTSANASRARALARRAIRSTSSSSSSASNRSSPTGRSCPSPTTSSSTRTWRSA